MNFHDATPPQVDLINAACHGLGLKFEHLLKTPLMAQREAAITRRLLELHPPRPMTEHEYQHVQPGQPLESAIGRIEGIQGEHSFILGGDFCGLQVTHGFDTFEHGEEAADAHALELLGGGDALFEDFKKAKEYHQATVAMMWSVIAEYFPRDFFGTENPKAKESIEDPLTQAQNALHVLVAGHAEAGIGEFVARQRIREATNMIRKAATEEYGLKAIAIN